MTLAPYLLWLLLSLRQAMRLSYENLFPVEVFSSVLIMSLARLLHLTADTCDSTLVLSSLVLGP